MYIKKIYFLQMTIGNYEIYNSKKLHITCFVIGWVFKKNSNLIILFDLVTIHS